MKGRRSLRQERKKRKKRPKKINLNLWVEGLDYKIADGGYEVLREKTIDSRVLGNVFDGPTLSLDEKGKITLKVGFWWDGDTCVQDVVLKASAFHDAGYWLITSEVIPETWACRRKIDKMYFNLNREGDMSWIRANGRYYGVRGIGWAFS